MFIYTQLRKFIVFLSKPVLLTYLYFVSRSRVPERAEVNKIIIPLVYGIGDTVIFSILIHKVIEAFGDREIVFLTTNRTTGVLEETFPGRKFIRIKPLWNILKMRGSFDLLISGQSGSLLYFVAAILKPRYIVGYNFSLKLDINASFIASINRILRQMELPGSNDPEILLSRKSQDAARELIRSRTGAAISGRIVSVIVGGMYESKQYPLDKCRYLVDRLLSRYDVTVLLIGKKVHGTDNKLAFGSERVIDFVGTTSVKEAMGLIHHSDLVIGPDGGLLNVAIGFRKRIIGLFGPVNYKRIVPPGYYGQVLFCKKCRRQPCYKFGDFKTECIHDKPICMDIDPQRIIDTIEERKLLPYSQNDQ